MQSWPWYLFFHWLPIAYRIIVHHLNSPINPCVIWALLTSSAPPFTNQHTRLFWRTQPQQSSCAFKSAWSSYSSDPMHVISSPWNVSMFYDSTASLLFLAERCLVTTSPALLKWPILEVFWTVFNFHVVSIVIYQHQLLACTFVFPSYLWNLGGQGQTSLFPQQL